MVIKRNRAIVILTIPRNGSSALGGSLQAMGCDMGKGFFQPADARNKKGYFEDMRFRKISNDLTGHRYSLYPVSHIPTEHQKLISQFLFRNKDKPVWGLKDTRMVLLWHLLKRSFEELYDVRPIFMVRSWKDVADSLMRHSYTAYGGRLRMSMAEATRLAGTWNSYLMGCYDLYEGEKFIITHYELMHNTEETLQKVYDYAFEGFKKHGNGIKRAVEFIDPTLTKGGRE